MPDRREEDRSALAMQAQDCVQRAIQEITEFARLQIPAHRRSIRRGGASDSFPSTMGGAACGGTLTRRSSDIGEQLLSSAPRAPGTYKTEILTAAQLAAKPSWAPKSSDPQTPCEAATVAVGPTREGGCSSAGRRWLGAGAAQASPAKRTTYLTVMSRSLVALRGAGRCLPCAGVEPRAKVRAEDLGRG